MTALDIGYWGGVIDDLEALGGPLRRGPGLISAFEVLDGTVGGVPIRATWRGRVKSGNTAQGSTLHLAVPIGGRPIRSYIWKRSNSTVFGPTATTGDADFDRLYIVAARPPEVVSAALDAPTRAIVRHRWPDGDTSLNVEDGWVSLIAGSSRPGRHGRREPPSREQLQAMLTDLVHIAGRLCTEYDNRRAAIAHHGGEAAAAAWEQGWIDDLQKVRRTGRWIAAIVVFAVLAVVAAVVVVLAT